ncbi:competence type IV pilus minor pilin ComGG [Gracilibacillus sp. Marseille-QA3620]
MSRLYDEQGMFLPVSLLFFTVIFVICLLAAGSFKNEVNYHALQTNGLRYSFLLTVSTKEAIRIADSGLSKETNGEWLYYNGKIKYQIIPQGERVYQIILTITTDQTVRESSIMYSASKKKVLSGTENL